MNSISVIGAGAFGTALAISLAKAGNEVRIIARNPSHVTDMINDGENTQRLAGFSFPKTLSPSDVIESGDKVYLLAVPTQQLDSYLAKHSDLLNGKTLVACCKGVDLTSGLGPTGIIHKHCPNSVAAMLSGPSFAVDIAAGLPTALTLACSQADQCVELQTQLSTSNLRLYRTSDVIGVEMGGALKNVIAIASGIAIGAGLGESARAALMTRGYAELVRFAISAGANSETLAGLSGFGDLVLTCTSEKSRNYVFGNSIGAGVEPPKGKTVEGASSAIAVSNLAKTRNIDMPITTTIAALLEKKLSVTDAIGLLMSRPLKEE